MKARDAWQKQAGARDGSLELIFVRINFLRGALVVVQIGYQRILFLPVVDLWGSP